MQRDPHLDMVVGSHKRIQRDLHPSKRIQRDLHLGMEVGSQKSLTAELADGAALSAATHMRILLNGLPPPFHFLRIPSRKHIVHFSAVPMSPKAAPAAGSSMVPQVNQLHIDRFEVDVAQ